MDRARAVVVGGGITGASVAYHLAKGSVEVKGMMPDRFQVAIDAYSMREGSTDMDAYLEGWRRGPVEERAGTPAEILAAIIQELDAEYPRTRLMNPT